MGDARLVRCGSCGATNRMPTDIHSGRIPVCGRCKTPLAEPPIEVTDATFAGLVERSPLPVLVDLWAPWCGPCRMMSPILEELAFEMAGRIRVAKLNVDDNPIVASRFNAQSIPLLLVLRNGREIDRMVGAQPKSEILRRLHTILTQSAAR